MEDENKQEGADGAKDDQQDGGKDDAAADDDLDAGDLDLSDLDEGSEGDGKDDADDKGDDKAKGDEKGSGKKKLDDMDRDELLKVAKSALAQKAKSKKDQEKKEPEAKREPSSSNDRTEFRIDHPDLPRAMVDQIEKFAKANSMSMEAALKQPMVQNFVNNKKTKERLANASASPRHKPTTDKPPKDWANATSQEVAEHAASIRRKGRG